MKKRYIFSLAALALLTAACSSDEMALNPADQPAPVEQKIPFTAVISADAAGTRALTEASDGKTITAKWEKGEEVALIHGSKTDVLKVDAVDATTGAATISGDITSPANDESVFVVYVGHDSENMTKFQESLTEFSGTITEQQISQAMNSTLTSQDGTLKGISDNFDFRQATAKFAVKDSKATFASEVEMPASYAIWKLNLTTDGTTALKVKDLLMQRTGDEEAHAAVDLGTETSSEFYLAFIPSAQANAYSFKATTSDDKTYTCTPTVSTTLEAGKFYRSTLTMTAGNTYRVYTAKDTYTDETIPSTATTLTGTVNPGDLAEGTYVVSGTATCAGDLTLTGDVNLILKDGASLTMTSGHIYGGADYGNADTYVLNIYGQTSGTGKLTINDSEIGGNPLVVKNLSIHGGEVNVTGGENSQGIETFGSLTIYNGTVKASGQYTGFMVCNDDMKVYGGEITATSTNGSALNVYNGNLVISGGSVDATGDGGGEGILCQKDEKGGTTTIDGGIVKSTAKGNAGVGLESNNIVINDGEVTATGGKANAESNGNGGAGIDGVLITVNGGIVTATGGAKDGTGSDGYGISDGSTITLGSGIKMYEGDSADPETPAASQTECTKRYVVIK